MQDAPLVIEALCSLDRSVVWEAVRFGRGWVSSTRSARQSSWPGRRVASSIRPTGIRPSRTSTTNWDAGHGFELVSRVVVQHRVRIRW